MDVASVITGLSDLCALNHVSEPHFARELSYTAAIELSLEKHLFPHHHLLMFIFF